MFGLGILGFDHLDLVYISSEAAHAQQERWFVIEGVRDVDPTSGKAVLGVVGWDGATTLSEANGGRTGRELSAHIGEPDERGGATLARGGQALETWSLMAGAAADIAHARYPYIAFAPVASPLPTVNSSSLVSSLLFHAGFDYSGHLPEGLRFSPGLSTLLASSGDDRLRLPAAFDAVLGGAGDDAIAGRGHDGAYDKLYGGRGSDTLAWSPGPGLMHGGEPGLPYAMDGDDKVSYAGAGPIEIVGHSDAKEHVRPDFTATFSGGQDDLYSIEELVWDDRSDHITVGPGAGLIRSQLSISSEGGDDVIDASAAGISLHVQGGFGDDIVVAGPMPVTLLAGPGDDTLIVESAVALVDVMDAAAGDRIHVPWAVEEVWIERDPARPEDAVLSVRGEVLGPDDAEAHDRERPHGAALVRIHDFEPGMFGLCVEPPQRVPIALIKGGGPAEDCRPRFELVRNEGALSDDDGSLPGSHSEEFDPGHF